MVDCAVIEELVRLHKASYLGGQLPAYDGKRSMYRSRPLPSTSKSFICPCSMKMMVPLQTGVRGLFKVVIRFAARAELCRIEQLQYIAGRQAEAPQEARQVIYIVLRELPTARYEPYSRSFFLPDLGRRRSLGDRVEIWRGVYQPIRPTQMELLLNITSSQDAVVAPDLKAGWCH